MKKRKKGSLSPADQITATCENGSYKHSKNFPGIFFVDYHQPNGRKFKKRNQI